MIDEKKHLGPDFYYDEKWADTIVNWFPTHVRHSVGPQAGEPFVLSEWEENDIIRPLFGVKRKEDGTRRYRVVWVEVPKKNGKTTLIAAVCVLATVGLGEPGAEVYSLACDRNQARICFNEAQRMVQASPTLKKHFHVYRGHLQATSSNSIYKPLSSEVGSNDGFNSFVVGIDEVHRQRNWELYRVMQYSMAARAEPFFFMMTTAGLFDPESLYFNLHERFMKVRSGEIKQDSALVCWYGADKDDDWEDEATWFKANPELGKAKSLQGMREDYKMAKSDPREINNFKRLHLNIITSQTTAAIDMEDWARNSGKVDESELIGRKCYGGLDLSKTTDLSAFLMVFPPVEEGERWKFIGDFWIPRDRIQKLQDQDGVPYDQWVQEGWLTPTDGNVVDYSVIKDRIVSLSKTYPIEQVAYDPWNCTQTALELGEAGIKMVEFRQGYGSMNEPTKEFLRAILEAKFNHGDNPILNWMASNLQVKQDPAGNIKPDKAASTQKIDGVVAAIMAYGRAILNEEATVNISAEDIFFV